MDVSGISRNGNYIVKQKDSSPSQASPETDKNSNREVSISSLASKLREGQHSLEREKLSQKVLLWDESKALLFAGMKPDVLASSKDEFKHLSKFQLETIALERDGIFNDSEKIAAHELWHTLDQIDLSDIRMNSLNSESVENAKESFKKALSSHIGTLSSLSKAMLPADYTSQAIVKFDFVLNELNQTQDDSRTKDYYQVMVDDLFSGKEPEILNGMNGMSLENLTRNSYDYLTQGDRKSLSDIYEYADKNDLDFNYIRRLAKDINNYRKHDDGKLLTNYNNATFDSEGHQRTVGFTDKDQTTIDTIRSRSMTSSPIDRGFISFITEPGLGALTHVGNYQFLQHILEATGGINTSVSADQFKVFEEFSNVDERYVISTSVETTLKIPEPDVICKNGICEVTDKGRKNGVTLLDDRKNVEPIIDRKSELVNSLFQYQINSETQDKIWFEWILND